MDNPQLTVDYPTQLVSVESSNPTISVLWDRLVQQAVVNDGSGPTISSRAYGMMHTAMYDAWSAYADIPISTNLEDELQRPESENTDANKSEAMSYAAYYVLVDLFPEQREMFDQQMLDLGYDPASISTDTSNPFGIGYVSAQALLNVRHDDGANQLGDAANGSGIPYSDYTGYQPSNQPEDLKFIELWTPELVSIDGELTKQEFLTPQWGEVTPFALESSSQFRPVAPEPFLLVDGTVDLENKTITLSDGEVVNISSELIGTVINPEFIAQAEEVVKYSGKLTDEDKLIAEFWEDGAGTSFPPGTFMTFGQYVSARDNHSLDEDAQMFFALGNAVFDAGIAAWDAKLHYNYARPVSVVRELGELGLIGKYDEDLGGYAIEAFSGYGEGTKTILASDFITYQIPKLDFSPPFPEYVSGHSTFSTAGAEVLQQYTGSDEFGGSVVFTPGTSRFEPGVTPVKTTTLTWDTFTDAADQSGISRLYGGIHFTQGDLNGRQLGREVGNAVYEQTQFYINGGNLIEQSGVMYGTDFPDTLSGDKQDNQIDGLAGDDELDGDKGNDSIQGGWGNDVILGDKGQDTLSGDEGNDHLDGGKDEDFLDGGTGDDTILGGKGHDTLFGSLGNDYLCGDKDDDLLDGGAGIDELVGDKGSDRFVLRAGDEEDLILDYDDGKDSFLLEGLTFDALEFQPHESGSQIIISQTHESLAIVRNIEIERLDLSDFVFSEAT